MVGKSIESLINLFFFTKSSIIYFPFYVLAGMIFCRYELNNFYTSEEPSAVSLVDIESTHLRVEFTSIHT
jgi:hypothetical protein